MVGPAVGEGRDLVEDLDVAGVPSPACVLATARSIGRRRADEAGGAQGGQGGGGVGGAVGRVGGGQGEDQTGEADRYLRPDQRGGEVAGPVSPTDPVPSTDTIPSTNPAPSALIGDVVRPLPQQQLGRGHAGGVEVGARVGVPAGREGLGGRIAAGPDDVRDVGEPGLVEGRRDPEVGQPHPRHTAPGRVEQQVGRLDVAVHEPFGMDPLQRLQQLVEKDRDPGDRQRPVVADQGRRRPAAHHRHREEDPLVLPRPAQRRQHVRVLDPHRLLAHEPEQRGGVGLPHDLRGHIPALAVVPGAPDDPGAALAERVDQLVASAQHLSHDRNLKRWRGLWPAAQARVSP